MDQKRLEDINKVVLYIKAAICLNQMLKYDKIFKVLLMCL